MPFASSTKSRNLIQPPKVNPRLVFEAGAPVARVSVEDAPQFAQHRNMLWILRARRIRGREQPPFHARIIKLLPHLEYSLLKRRRMEKLVHRICRALVPDVFVVCSVS